MEGTTKTFNILGRKIILKNSANQDGSGPKAEEIVALLEERLRLTREDLFEKGKGGLALKDMDLLLLASLDLCSSQLRLKNELENQEREDFSQILIDVQSVKKELGEVLELKPD